MNDLKRTEAANNALAAVRGAMDQGHTVEQVAERCGVHPAAVRDVLCGHATKRRGGRRVTAGTLGKILAVYPVP